MAFQPLPNDNFDVDRLRYIVAEHPAAPGVAYGQEGRAAIVYQIMDQQGAAWALKVFRPRFRVPALVSLADKLASFANIPGLSVCRRTVLTSRKHTELLRQYPDLTYAVLMPWIDGPTWMQVVLEQQPFTPEQSLRLARALLHLLAEMEERGLAHCDLSGPNLILPALAANANASANIGSDVALVDVEQMLGPDLSKPTILPGGSAGYAHKTAPEGVWSAEADRFAGAVLLAEILGWCDERVRRSASGESYFTPEEVQHDSARYQRIMTSLRDYWSVGVANLFEHAWHSETLGDCPTFGEWLVTLPQSAMSPAQAETEVESPPDTAVVEEGLPGPKTDPEILLEIWPETVPLENPLRDSIEAPDSSSPTPKTDDEIILEIWPKTVPLENPLLDSIEAPDSSLQALKVMPTDWVPVGIIATSVGLVIIGFIVLILVGLLWWQPSANNVRLTAEAGTAVAVQEIAVAATEQAQLVTVRARATASAQAQAHSTATDTSEPPTSVPTKQPTPTPLGGGSGQIAFVSERDGNSEIYVMNADGGGQARLTNNAVFPAWSPDGERIAFVSERDGNREIYVMNADGSGQTRLTNNAAYDLFPAWSPDGERIAFVSERDGNSELYVMNADGTGQTKLTNTNNVTYYDLAWSPNGTLIASHSHSYYDGTDEIYIINADGTGQRRLTNNTAQELYATWSPAGTRIAFSSFSYSRPDSAEIYVMNTDSSSQTRLTNNAAGDASPAWSPDGTRIAFVSDRDGNAEIYVMNADGSDQTRLTDNATFDGLPAWSPDGTRIAFVSDRDGNAEIYVMNADGSDQTRLTDIAAFNSYPAWRP